MYEKHIAGFYILYHKALWNKAGSLHTFYKVAIISSGLGKVKQATWRIFLMLTKGFVMHKCPASQWIYADFYEFV